MRKAESDVWGLGGVGTRGQNPLCGGGYEVNPLKRGLTYNMDLNGERSDVVSVKPYSPSFKGCYSSAR